MVERSDVETKVRATSMLQASRLPDETSLEVSSGCKQLQETEALL